MTFGQRYWLVALLFCAVAGRAQIAGRLPHLGYVYPAGGQVGTTFRVAIGGQFLNDSSALHVTGEGISGKVAEHIAPISQQQLGLVNRRIYEVQRVRWAEAAKRTPDPLPELTEPLPDHPLVRGIEQKTLPELEELRAILNDPRKQPNSQIGETVLVDVTIDRNAPTGDRELRLVTAGGLTNPLCFQVGLATEVTETELIGRLGVTTPTVDLPALFNGQILPGDVDRFRFRARKGDQLVARAQARQLMPYLADAVPGWFQATLALYDATGAELAFADDYYFDPDPVLLYRIPADGEYEVEVRDSIYRGRDDFVYRITVGEHPFITAIYPLGAPEGVAKAAWIGGWNLPTKDVQLDTKAGGEAVRSIAVRRAGMLSNAVPYAVDHLPETTEVEPSSERKPQVVTLPRIINGCIVQPGDVDCYQFEGQAGTEVVAAVAARKLRSSLDSVLRLTDSAGKQLAWNDDYKDDEQGLLTHHADSYLRAKLPTTGSYIISIADSQQSGSQSHGYRLRIGPPQPDFALRLIPASISFGAGGVAPARIHVLRKDGFTGAVELALKDAPQGFTLTGGRIPSGRDSVRVTIGASSEPPREPVCLQLEGHAKVGERSIARPVVPAEDMMQAFAYRHLVPATECVALVTDGRRRVPALPRKDPGAITIPAGGTRRVVYPVGPVPRLNELRLLLSEPPKGLTMSGPVTVPGGFALDLKAQAETPAIGYQDNLIVEVFFDLEVGKTNDGKPRTRGISIGVLPAIPFEIVAK
ncbi:MAG: PPC domain-containing protein [Armatimonadetes bacterium]|nr:PPC domain-containing protein [Armatimonadota bacterium]